MNEFFRCVAEAVLENGIKGLAGMVPGGPYVYAVGESAIKKYRERRRDKQQHDDFLELANVKLEDARVEVVRIVNDAVAKLPPSDPPPTEEEIIDLVQYLSGIPDAVRQSLKRPEDPIGKSLPDGFALNSADDVVKILPPRPPRFRPGMVVPNKPGWVLDRLLGMGGFGEVWFARHARVSSLSGAIKFCFDKNGRDLIHEADLIDRVMAAKHHPNIVPLKDAHLEGDTPWLLFEYVGGGCLTDWIHSLAALPNEKRLPQVITAIKQLAEAVGSFHKLSRPIVHRDLKPSNILLDKENKKLRITDFGIGSVTAKEINLLESRGQSTQGGRLLSYMRGSHTPIYSSPQQRRGDNADPRDDVHALGVIAYQMLTGKLDSGPGTGSSRALKRMTVPDEISELILSCASEDVADRPATAAILLKQLNALVKLKPVVLQVVSQPTAPTGKPNWYDGVLEKSAPAPKGFSPTSASDIRADAQTLPAPILLPPPLLNISKPSKRKAGDKLTIPLSGGKSMAFAYCPAGSFQMGSVANDDEKPVHKVSLANGFYAGVYPVTQAEYEAVMGKNPSHFKGPKRPVEQVNWAEGVEFCAKLSAICGREIRLPTEAEWEYSCRAGSKGEYCNGEGEALLKRVGWFDANSQKETHPVGELQPNEWGLYDCHGNVWEWCADWYADWYGDKAYQRGECVDPSGPQSGSSRVYRGGSWFYDAGRCRSARRGRSDPSSRYHDLGFRCVAGQ